MQDPVLLILACGAEEATAPPDAAPGASRRPDAFEAAARVARTALATGYRPTAALPAERPALRAAFAGGRVNIVLARGADLLPAGLAALPPGVPVMVLGADQAGLATEDLRQMLSAWRATPDLILCATDDAGTSGHPLCLPAWARAAVEETGGTDVLMRRHAGRMRMFALEGDRARSAVADRGRPDTGDARDGRGIRALLAARRAQFDQAQFDQARIMRPAEPAPRTV